MLTVQLKQRSTQKLRSHTDGHPDFLSLQPFFLSIFKVVFCLLLHIWVTKQPGMSCREHEAQREVKNEFFSQWDGLRTGGTGVTDRIMVLGATNRPQVRDSVWLWCGAHAFYESSWWPRTRPRTTCLLQHLLPHSQQRTAVLCRLRANQTFSFFMMGVWHGCQGLCPWHHSCIVQAAGS